MATFEYNFRCEYDGQNYLVVDPELVSGTLTDGEPDDTFEVNASVSTVGVSNFPFWGIFTSNVGETAVEFLVVGGVGSFAWVFAQVPASATLGDVLAALPGEPGLAPDFMDYPPICFAAGTRIATPTGERDVETLAMGDPILASDGRTIAVRWVGRQTKHKLITRERDFAPVCVRAGALAPGVPHSDLTLTGDHALILGDLAVNAAALVNGTTIAFVPMEALPDRVTYYHIETEAHEEIIANGAPAETFVDYVGRRSFDNHQEYLDLYGCERIIPEMRRPRISSRRQLPPALAARFGIARFGDDVEADSAALTARLMAG